MIAANEDFLVYKITNMVNGKLYFGITTQSLRIRWNLHKHNSIHQKKKSHLNRAILKYSPGKFKIDLVQSCQNEQEMYATEIGLIAQFNTTNRLFGYNNSTGGEKSTAGSKRSPECIKRLSEYQRNRKRKPHSKAAIEKMRQAASGRDMGDLYLKSSATKKGKIAPNKLPVKQFTLLGEFVKEHNSYTSAAKSVNGVPGGIWMVKIGRLKTYKSFLWQF